MDVNSGALLSAVLLFQTVWKQKTETVSATQVLPDGGGECPQVFRPRASAADLGPHEVGFNFPLVFVRRIARLGVDMTLSRNGGFILPTVKRLRHVRVLRCAYAA